MFYPSLFDSSFCSSASFTFVYSYFLSVIDQQMTFFFYLFFIEITVHSVYLFSLCVHSFFFPSSIFFFSFSTVTSVLFILLLTITCLTLTRFLFSLGQPHMFPLLRTQRDTKQRDWTAWMPPRCGFLAQLCLRAEVDSGP